VFVFFYVVFCFFFVIFVLFWFFAAFLLVGGCFFCCVFLVLFFFFVFFKGFFLFHCFGNIGCEPRQKRRRGALTELRYYWSRTGEKKVRAATGLVARVGGLVR